MPTVRMPDGASVNFPDTMPKEQIKSLIASKFPDAAQPLAAPSSSLPTPQNTAQPAVNTPIDKPAAPTADASLPTRLREDIRGRFQTGVDIMGKRNEQNPLSTGLQMAGKVVAGTMGDIVGEVSKSAYDVLPESIKKNIQNDPITKAAIMGAKSAGEVYSSLAKSEWAQKHPEAFANIESLANIAGALPAAKAAGIAGRQAIKPIPVVGAVAKGMEMPSGKALKKEATTKTMAAGKGIQEAKTAGVVIDPVESSKFYVNIGSIVDETNPTKANASKNTLEAVKRIQSNIDRGDTSFDNLIIERNELQKARSMGGEEGMSAGKAIEALDKHIEDVYAGDKVVGGSKADIKKYQDKMAEYGEAKRYESIVDILNSSKGNAPKLKAKMQRLVDSENFKFYSKDVQNLIKKAAAGKTSGNVLDVVAKISNAIPVVGQLTGMIIGGTAKKISGTIAKGTAGDVLKAIEKNK